MGLTCCHKTTVFYIYVCSFYLNLQPWYQYSNFENKWPLLAVPILALLSSSACDLALASDDRWLSCDVMSTSKMAATASQIYFCFQFWWRITFKNVQIYSHTKFRQYSSIRGWDITISGFWKETVAILKFYFRFSLSFSTSLTCDSRSAYQILSKSDVGGRVMTSWRFPGWRPPRRTSTSGFRVRKALQLRTSKSICILNFDNVRQSAAEILLFPVSNNQRPPY